MSQSGKMHRKDRENRVRARFLLGELAVLADWEEKVTTLQLVGGDRQGGLAGE
jgi:hypothetical protein